MGVRVLKRILLLCLVLGLLLPGTAGADQEGYAMAVGEVRIYLDHGLTRLYGTLGDASVVYVVQARASKEGTVYTLIFGVDNVLRLGYASAEDLMPLGSMETEMYESGAVDCMLYNGRIRLLNCRFALYGVTVPPAPTPSPTAAWYVRTEEQGITPLPEGTGYARQAVSAGGITILVQPADVHAFNGEEFILAVAAEGAVSCQWQYYDGEEWKDSLMSQAASPAMTLVAFSGGRERIYRCVLTGRDGTTVCTREAHIYVQ